MSTPHDNRLDALERELDEFLRGQDASYRKMEELRRNHERDLQKLQRDYEYEVEALRRNYDAASRQIDDVRRQIERRKRELEHEATAKKH